MRQCDLTLPRLIGSVVPEGPHVADARRGRGRRPVAGLVEGLGEDVGGAAEEHVCLGHIPSSCRVRPGKVIAESRYDARGGLLRILNEIEGQHDSTACR